MVYERAQLKIAAGQNAAFEAAMADEGLRLFDGAAGCHSVYLGASVEEPQTYLLLIEWDEVDAHVAFTSTPEFAAFRALAGPFFDGAPEVLHFRHLS